MRPKCHPILLDTSLHSAVTVRLNLFQAFLLAAMKFHCHHSSLSQVTRKILYSRVCHIASTGLPFNARQQNGLALCNPFNRDRSWLKFSKLAA